MSENNDDRPVPMTVLLTEEGIIIPNANPVHRLTAYGYDVLMLDYSECDQVQDLKELLDYLKDPTAIEPSAFEEPSEERQNPPAYEPK